MWRRRVKPRISGSRAGFTLTELLIVVAILSIIALIIVPGSGATDETARLRAAAQLLVADLDYARVRSIGNGADRCVVVFDAPNGYRIAQASDPDTPIREPGSKRPYLTRFGDERAFMIDGVTVDGYDLGGDDRLEFTALGSLDESSDATIVLRCGAHTVQVVLDSATGDSQIE